MYGGRTLGLSPLRYHGIRPCWLEMVKAGYRYLRGNGLMRVSIVTADGTTTYSESIAPVENVTEDFSTVLEEAGATATKDGLTTDEWTKDLEGVYSLADIFEEAADTYGVDINLLTAVAKQESNFRADATSSSGAQGIMQLMPATAGSLGVEHPYDAYENIMGGAHLLSDLLKRYDGDESLALAAYNAGSGNVAKYGGIPPFAETQNYVKKVLEYKSQGVEVPSEVYTKESLSKEDAALNLDVLLKEFPNHNSFSEFLEQMEKLQEEDMAPTSDAQVAYQKLLSTANQAIINMLNE